MSRGASLLETMVVLVVTAVLVAGTVTGVHAMRSSLVLRLESDRLRLVLERAYALALTSDCATRIAIEGNRVTISKEAQMIESYRTARGVTLEPPAHLDGFLRFYPSHAASPATITIRSGSNSCAVTISLRGRIRTTC
jgi:hypothetical protein